MWMISYEYKAVMTFRNRPGGDTSTGEPHKTINIIDKHPIEFLRDTKANLAKLEDGEGTRADDIIAVFWTMEIPAGLMDQDEIDDFS
jgi:hypothetical protein